MALERLLKKKRRCNEMKATVFSYTRKGALLAARLADILIAKGYAADIYTGRKYLDADPRLLQSRGCRADAQKAFADSKAVIYIGSCGIAIRSIAPFLKDKTMDPAVLDIDEGGSFVIALLAGHIGGANALARYIAKELGAQAVITTATDVNGLLAVDEWAMRHNCHIASMAMAKRFAAALLEKREIGFESSFPIEGALPPGFVQKAQGEIGLVIAENSDYRPFKYTLNLVPRVYALGIGCKKDTPMEKIEALVVPKLREMHIGMEAIREICSVDLKQNEPGLLAFAQKYCKTLSFFSAEELNSLKGSFTSSDLVKKIVGTDNVCERAAMCASATGEVTLPKTSLDGVTMALVKSAFRVDFQSEGV